MANPRFVLRSLDVFALYRTTNLPPFGNPAAAALLAAINKEQGVSILARQVTVGAPTPTVNDALFNTSVTLDSVVGQGYKGPMTVRYNRADAALSSTLANLVLPGDQTFAAANVHALIPLINSTTGLSFVTDDFVNDVIPAGSKSFTLKAASTSYFFLPGSTFKVFAGAVTGDPWMLFDVNTLTDRMGTGATGVLTSAAADPTYLIDGEPSLKITGAGTLKINLATLFDSTIPEWTMEWSSRLNASTTGYANLFYMHVGATNTFIQRTGDAGFGLRIQQGIQMASADQAWNLPFGSAAKNGVLTRYAAVKKNGIISMFVDGKLTNMAVGTGNAYTVKGFPAGAGVANNNEIVIGTLAQNIGHIRISKFARYSIDYTPAPFKQPSFAFVAPVTDALGFDPEGGDLSLVLKGSKINWD